MRNYLKAFLSIGTMGLLFYTIIDLNTQVKTYKRTHAILIKSQDSLVKINDSLQTEVFTHQVELGRVEIAVNQALSKYPLIYEEYQRFVIDSTE